VCLLWRRLKRADDLNGRFHLIDHFHDNECDEFDDFDEHNQQHENSCSVDIDIDDSRVVEIGARGDGPCGVDNSPRVADRPA
jgi:hypothetical protein